MKIRYIYQNNNKKIKYTFENEKITVEYNAKTEIFDFTDFPDGIAEVTSDVLDICPVLSAKKENDILYVELLQTYTDEERTAIETNLKTLEEWQEVF